MKRLAISCAIAALATFAMAEDDGGGYLTLWPKDHGRFLFIDAQRSVGSEIITKYVRCIQGYLGFDIAYQKGVAPELKEVPGALEKLGAKGAIWIVEDPTLPLTLGACEDDWGFLNVAKILADKPDAGVIESRIEKLINRLFAQIHGIGDPVTMPQCVMKPAVGLAGIDALRCRMFSPIAMMTVSGYMSKAGYKSMHEGTYQDACEGGWAPAPTNDVQRAIWNKVHAMPTNPIRIKPGDKPKSKR